jgi:hypothetical protein
VIAERRPAGKDKRFKGFCYSEWERGVSGHPKMARNQYNVQLFSRIR